jgi:hypothetical protein
MLSIATSLEAIVKIFFTGSDELSFWDGKPANLYEKGSLLNDKINKIITKLGGEDINFKDLITHRNGYMHAKQSYIEVTSQDIIDWFEQLLKIITIIDKPINYIPFDKKEYDKKRKKQKEQPPKNLRKNKM